jgi:sterol desaturase/sphingolipid hydroxylase (fatty acid hydroxylase superfamily)
LTDIIALLQRLGVRELLVLALVFVPLERLFTAHAQPILRRWWWDDLVYFSINRFIITVGLGALVAGTGVIAARLVPPAVPLAIESQPLWLQVVEALVIADLGFYTAHRMFHRVPWLWRFHAIHHSIEELDWLAAVRVHPLDQIVTKAFSLIPLYALGFSEVTLGIFSVIYFWQSFLVHANVRIEFGPLKWVIASPEFHHWHHANHREAYDMNFAGQLSILDRLFGTLYMPAGQTPAAFGIDDPVPHTYLKHLWYPFSRRQPADR